MNPSVALAMAVVSVPLALLGFGLMEFAEALWEFNYISEEAILGAVAAVALFLNGLMASLGLASIAAAIMGPVLLSIGVGLYLFGRALQKFNTIGPEAVHAAVAAVGLFTAMALNMGLGAPVMMAFAGAMMMMGKGLETMAVAFQEMYGLESVIGEALPSFFASLGGMSMLALPALYAVATGIMAISSALMFLPEAQIIAVGYVFKNLGNAIATMTAAEPNKTAAVAKIATESAAAVANRVPTGTTGAAAGAGAGGGRPADVVLVLNERELGRAVEAVLEKRHNLRID